MRFGVREICDVVFKAKANTKIGSSTFKKGQPVLYIDTATASTLEQATTTVYAQGGKGNTRLITWEGEKTLTFTVTDALLSPIGMSILANAGLFKGAEGDMVHVHMTATAPIEAADGNVTIDLTDALADTEKIDATAPVFAVVAEEDGSVTGILIEVLEVDTDGKKLTGAATLPEDAKMAFVDFYVAKESANVSEIQIDAASFGGSYYVEASTLFRRQSDGVDMPCEITLPNVKIQSNFTFSMASSGDPSTFDFTMDAMPGYTMFDKTHKVLCVMQVVEDAVAGAAKTATVMGHSETIDKTIDENADDSLEANNG